MSFCTYRNIAAIYSVIKFENTYRIDLSVIHKPEHGLRWFFIAVFHSVPMFTVIRFYKINCFYVAINIVLIIKIMIVSMHFFSIRQSNRVMLTRTRITQSAKSCIDHNVHNVQPVQSLFIRFFYYFGFREFSMFWQTRIIL